MPLIAALGFASKLMFTAGKLRPGGGRLKHHTLKVCFLYFYNNNNNVMQKLIKNFK